MAGTAQVVSPATRSDPSLDALRESEARYRAMAEGTPVMIWTTDPAGVVTFVNRAYCEFHGVSQLEVAAGGWQPIVHADDAAAYLGAFRAALEGRTAFHAEARVRRRDGEWRWIESFGEPRFGEAGEFQGMTGSSPDVTARKAAEEALRTQAGELAAALARAGEEQRRLEEAQRALRRSEQLYRAIGESIDYGVWVCAPDGRNIYASESFLALVGLTQAQCSDFGWGSVLHPDDAERTIAAWKECVRTVGTWDIEHRFRGVDGRWHPILARGVPVRDERGDLVCWAGINLDIERLKAAEEGLREADARKRQFLAVLSHELRNPLAPIRDGILLLERAPPGSAEALRAREILKRQAEHLTRLVDDLLDLTRIDHGKIDLQLATVDAREVVRRACADVHASFLKAELALAAPAPGAPAWVRADATRLAQMVGNLLANALKFSAPGGHVEVSVEEDAGRCRVRVKDDGAGIEPENLGAIFDPFVQAERTRHGKGGLGIGLALVRELAARHGGTIRAESAGPGQGATFALELPAAESPPARAGAVREHPTPTGLSVLIVEDNTDAATTLADLLALKGHHTRQVATGSAGVEAVAARAPDVLICDVGLPDRDGYEVIRAVRALPGGRDLFAIALTGYAQPKDQALAREAGFDAHLAKPADAAELQALLAQAGRRRG